MSIEELGLQMALNRGAAAQAMVVPDLRRATKSQVHFWATLSN
jgi:hypothetical protein